MAFFQGAWHSHCIKCCCRIPAVSNKAYTVGTELFHNTLEKDALGVSVKGSQLMQQMLQHPKITALSTFGLDNSRNHEKL